MEQPKRVIIERRFRGPPDSGNGGYSCGVLGALFGLGAVTEVTLRKPPPLDRPFDVASRADGSITLELEGELVAEAKPSTLDVTPPAAPSFDEAVAASTRYAWREDHPYPTCFVCGPKRPPHDGLCVFPGPVEGRAIAAAPFVPDETLVDASGTLRPEIAWATLDCPSWFGFHVLHPTFSERVLLGRLTARIDKLPKRGDRCIAVGWSLGREGRKIPCGSALYTESGALLALAQAMWIVLK